MVALRILKQSAALCVRGIFGLILRADTDVEGSSLHGIPPLGNKLVLNALL